MLGVELGACCTCVMTRRPARYDGHARWYDTTYRAYADSNSWGALLQGLLGPPPVPGAACLEVGAGTSLHAASIASQGYTPVGLDLSLDQLRVGRERASALVQGDAARLPFRSKTFPRVVSVFTHTDMDDFRAVVGETARVLTDGGRLVYIGLHPCFVGTFLDRSNEMDTRTLSLRSGYGDEKVRMDTSGRVSLRSRVGGNNLSLAQFLQAFLHAPGLSLRSFRELDTASSDWNTHADGRLVPWNVALVAEKTADSPSAA
jgi:SAM-dependent methyltransferase